MLHMKLLFIIILLISLKNVSHRGCILFGCEISEVAYISRCNYLITLFGNCILFINLFFVCMYVCVCIYINKKMYD